MAKATSAKSVAEVRSLLSEVRRQPAPKAPAPSQEPAAAKPAAGETPAAETATLEPEPAAVEETPADGTTTPETPTEEPAQTEPEPAKTEPEEPDEDTLLDGPVTPSQAKKLRLRLPETDKVGRLAAAYLQRNRDWSLEQAMDAARNQLGVKTQPAREESAAEPKSNLPETPDAVDAAIKQLRADRKKANAELRFEDVSDMSDKLEDLLQHRVVLERRAERQQLESERSYETKFTASEAKATELYDFASKPDSEGGKRMKEIEADLEANGDPLFHDPDKPLRIAQMVARELSIAPRRKGATAPVKAAPSATPMPGPKKGIVPSGASRTTPVPVNAQPAVISEVQKARNPYELKKALKQFGIR